MKSDWHGLIFFFSLIFGITLLIASTIEESIEVIIIGLIFLVIAFFASKKGWKR